MGFTLLNNSGPVKIGALLVPGGARISVRKIARRKEPGASNRYIKIELGADAAKAIGLHQARSKVQLLFGEGSDAGKIAISPDNEVGMFSAAKRSDGSFVITINSQSAEARFKLDFEAFGVEKAEILSLPGHTKKAILGAAQMV